jgi:hypothetical protein
LAELCLRCGLPVPDPDDIVARKALADALCRTELNTLLSALNHHSELDVNALVYHICQSEMTASGKHYHAAANEARTLLEVLVTNIGLEVQRPRDVPMAEFRKRKEHHFGFPSCNQYLKEVGFWDATERIALERVHAITAGRAGNFGGCSRVWYQLVQRMVWATTWYTIERYNEWKAGCTCRLPD